METVVRAAPSSDDELVGELTEAEQAQVAFGRAYPFERPDHSFLFCTETHEVTELDAGWTHAEEAELVPVIACGSNAAPVQLRRKYPKGTYAGKIPVVAGCLRDYDSVFCPMLASYGSMTATLAPSPGAELRVHVTYLTREQLVRMHETEGGYHYGLLENIQLHLDNGGRLTEVHGYIHKHGLLMSGGKPISISHLPCKGRAYPEMSQPEVLDKFARALNQAPGEHFILTVINSKKRHMWNKKLATSHAGPFVGDYTVVDTTTPPPDVSADKAVDDEDDFTGLGM